MGLLRLKKAAPQKLGTSGFSEPTIFFQEIVDKAASFSHCAFRRGAVAQLGERLNGIQEAVSSILSSSTRFLKTPDHRKMAGGFGVLALIAMYALNILNIAESFQKMYFAYCFWRDFLNAYRHSAPHHWVSVRNY